MSKAVLLAGTAALALSAGCASAAGAAVGPTTLWDQNAGDGDNSIISEIFTTGTFHALDSAGADDFVVPAGQKWVVEEVDTTGFDAGFLPHSVNVTFYKSRKRLPNSAKAVRTCLNQNFTDTNGGDLAIPLSGCSGKTTLGGGTKGRTYWVSVVANKPEHEEVWAWQTNKNKNLNGSAWENPNDGMGTGCITWTRTKDCFSGVRVGPDFAFALQGQVK